MKVEGKIVTIETHESAVGTHRTALIKRVNEATDVPFVFDHIHLGSAEVVFKIGQKVIVEVVE
jgi:hypothetical protein